MARSSFSIPRQTRRGDDSAAISARCCGRAACAARDAQSITARSIEVPRAGHKMAMCPTDALATRAFSTANIPYFGQ